MAAEEQSLRERVVALKLQRDELAWDIADLSRQVSSGQPDVTPEKARRLSELLRDKLSTGPAECRQAYARLVVQESPLAKARSG